MAFEVLPCPFCGHPCEADWVDVEVGWVQCGPYWCESCGASEVGPYDKKGGRKTLHGWYVPGSGFASTVNVFEGKPVSHHVAEFLYKKGG